MDTTNASVHPFQVSFFEALKFWLKLGFISFGGPAGQIAIMHRELVEEKRWISEGRFLHALNYCMLLPGPEAQQLATYIGWLMHRSWGGIVAGALFVLPSLFILIGLSWVYVAFGGFVGGWSKQVLGPDALFAGAALAATLVTWFTFLPSFLFILAGGPLVESTHGKLQFTAPLTAITAAVVGVIASLGLFFIAHIAYRSGATGGFISRLDGAALSISLVAAVASLRYKLGVIPVIAACALTGLGLRLLGWA